MRSTRTACLAAGGITQGSASLACLRSCLPAHALLSARSLLFTRVRLPGYLARARKVWTEMSPISRKQDTTASYQFSAAVTKYPIEL
ncbi:uncharacterized protein SCHCODRAFT_02180742 [Schizophyllum commune H4-8]|uniref:uncharacterized protein n=1 Tax=Schizophyllum commune (strain H4-8 / FGSC 9210) TaxID=578458 RepID=UPI00215DE243|nr:uncharacterized protein SCHCODRAFT_02180742 [Schizophyllum commune H4-8]KAI5895996.1 hypothetical protein SCHCODRAFT_02180742 [Schizophyllum commune H4-8]